MPTFEYLALDAKGKQARGSIAAESAAAARKQLRTRRLHPTKLKPISESSQQRKWDFRQSFGSRRRHIMLDFTRQLGTMIEADIKLTESLGILIGQSRDEKFSQLIQNIRDQVIAGDSFADAIEGYKEWFDPIYIAMIRVGEVTGNLARPLNLLADYMAKRQRLETKIKAALTYPAILMVICIFVVIILMTFVVPRITEIIVSANKTIPMVTSILIGISDIILHWWWAIILGIFLIVWLFRRSLATTRGRLMFDQFIIKAPIIGEVMRLNIVARFTSTLAALIRSGLPMADCLQVVAKVTGNTVMSLAIERARERIIAGADIATPLRESKVVDPTIAHMISVGERTGELEKMLLTIAESMEESTDIIVQRLSSIVEPVIIVIMAVLVGFIIYGTLMPIFEMAKLPTT